jgi:hypothetical protein
MGEIVSSKWAEDYQRRKAYFESYAAKRYEQKRLIRRQKRIERASLPPKPRKRFAPFAEVGRRGGAVSPHSKCVPCLSSLGASRAQVSRLTGIDQSTLKAHGFSAIAMKDRIAMAHRAKRAVSYLRIDHSALMLKQIRVEASTFAQIDSIWAFHHPEYVRWRGNRQAAINHQRYKSNPEYLVKRSIRHRLWKVAKGMISGHRTVEYLGCSASEFRRHLERLLEPGMSWSNYGDWEIDHIKPCASFDLSIHEELLKCFNYTNTRPMWRSENRKKWSYHGGVMHRRNRVQRNLLDA